MDNPNDTTPAAVMHNLQMPVNFAILPGTMIASHFVLWNSTRLRRRES